MSDRADREAQEGLPAIAHLVAYGDYGSSRAGVPRSWGDRVTTRVIEGSELNPDDVPAEPYA